MSGDGAFIKGNRPFKERLKELLNNPNLKWRWDILHLINRAFGAARDYVGQGVAHSTLQLMKFVQGQSKTWRTGLDYTSMKLDALKSFKRPKVWSDTRMVNYEYDQLLRFCECSAWWDLPNWVDILSRLYVPVTYVLKVILSKAQSTKVKTEWILRVLCGDSPDGLHAMKCAVSVAKAAIEGNDYSHLIDNMPDILKTTPDEDNVFQSHFRKWFSKNKDLFVIDRLGDAITRNELNCSIDGMTNHVLAYTDKLFEEIADRMQHSDTDGTTSWSEAPAESIFSVFKMVLHGRESLSVGHTVALCRLITNGPRPGTVEAEKLMNQAAEKWKSHNGLEFTTQNWQIRFISKLISRLKGGNNCAEDSDNADD